MASPYDHFVCFFISAADTVGNRLLTVKSADMNIYIYIHYLPISSWTLLILHFLLKIWQNTQRITLKLQECKGRIISHIFQLQFCPKNIQGTRKKFKIRVWEHHVKSIGSNAMQLQQMFMMLLSSIRVHLLILALLFMKISSII